MRGEDVSVRGKVGGQKTNERFLVLFRGFQPLRVRSRFGRSIEPSTGVKHFFGLLSSVSCG